MKFIFETENINERAYRRIMNRYILENFGRETFSQLREWVILVRSSTRIGEDPFFHGTGNGTGGVTGLGMTRLYLFDVDDFGLFLRTNVVTISHELAHTALLVNGMGERVPLRNDDFSGNKKGDILAYSTAEVHDRHIEGKFYTATEWLWTGLIWRRISYNMLDFRDHYGMF